ncbi:MAG: aspartate--tRNA ligase [Bacilli bacterium]|nr:aspartate--tRNA ligase [Bacilli bacterium]
MRTKNNNELRLTNVGETVTLVGWCNKKRDLGGLVFLDLRDRYGITQLVIEPHNKNYAKALEVKNEYVLKATGKVVERSNKNPNLPTGDIEVLVDDLVILNTAENPPLLIQDQTDALEEVRMRYRYLDLRRPVMQKNIIMRHKVAMSIRNYLDALDFIEVETPLLGKSTPEGARDFLVPSRVYPGSFYALPQSPQMYKQLLMIAGLEKYYQLVKCFRDEDLRADRQLEFTQVDIEMSFIDEEDIQEVVEGMLKRVWKDTLNIDIPTPFPRITYHEAINKYGTDKPDTRFELFLQDISCWAKGLNFPVFDSALNKGGVVKAIVVPFGAEKYSRKEIDRLTEIAKKYHASGLAWLKVGENGLSGSFVKYINEENSQKLSNQLSLKNHDLVLVVADSWENANFALGALRLQVAKEMNLIDQKQFNFLWVVDWPLFEYSEEEKRYVAAHHPFTSPKDDQVYLMLTAPEKVLAKAYDVVLNGYELGGGSIRIHNQEIQNRMFKAIGMLDEEIEQQFSFFTDALKYGTPPHGGIALGFDRIAMLLTYNTSLREVIAFPKAASARCLMSDAPSRVSERQLKELGIKIDE